MIQPLVNAAQAPAIVYKTRGDYDDLVWVLLEEDGSIGGWRVDSSSGPKELDQGYLLGYPSPDGAYLDITYEEYSQFDELPPHEDMIKDDDPFLEMYDCGNRYGPGHETKEKAIERLNTIINQDRLEEECDSMLDKSEKKPEPSHSYLLYWMTGIVVAVTISLYFFKRKR